MQFTINQYISEVQNELTALLDNEDNLLIVSPTDSGKTYSIIDYANKTNKRVAFLMPTQNLVNNLQEKYTICAGYGRQWAKDNQHQRFVCTTFDSYSYFDKEFDIVIIDEAHTIGGHGNFRTEALAPLLDINQKKVLLTGTPEIIEYLKGYKRVEFMRKTAPKYANIIESTASAKSTAFELIKNRDKKKLLIVRINNKTTIDEIYEAFKNDMNIVKLYSDSEAVLYAEQDKATIDLLKKGIVPMEVDVILCTSILDAGISLEVNRDVDCWALSDKHMPNAIDVVQLYARVRTSSNYKMQLNIVGNYGKQEIPNGYTLYEKDSSLCAQQMNLFYKTYRSLDAENYINLLAKYGIRCEEKLQRIQNIKDAEYTCKLKPFKIATNLQNFPAEHKKIEDRLKDKGLENCINYFTGDKNIKPTLSSAVVRIIESINLAIDKNIHPCFFMDESFKALRLKNLITATDEFNTSDNFRAVMLELLRGLELKEGGKHKMNLEQYKRLSEPQKDAVKCVSNLLYSGRQWKRKTIALKRISADENTDTYLQNFLWLSQSKVA